jgi:hypothetical protein
MLATPEFWVLVSFVLFVGLLVYLKVPHRWPRRSTSGRRAFPRNSTKPANCATRPRRCLPSMSASAGTPKRRPRRSSSRPARRPKPSPRDPPQAHRDGRAAWPAGGGKDRPGRGPGGQGGARRRGRTRHRRGHPHDCRAGSGRQGRSARRQLHCGSERQAALSLSSGTRWPPGKRRTVSSVPPSSVNRQRDRWARMLTTRLNLGTRPWSLHRS